MCKELENVIILDREAGKIYNLSQVVSPDARGEKASDGVEKIQLALTFTQDILAVPRFKENDFSALSSLSAYIGGYMESSRPVSVRNMFVIKYRRRAP